MADDRLPSIDEIDAMEPYEQISAMARHRESEFRPMFAPAVEVTDAYGRMLARAVLILGDVAPASAQDASLRDLMADTYDYLYDWRRILLEGRAHMAYPVGRRAYESLSLFAASSQNPELLARWEKGREIKNDDVRKALAAAATPESEDSLRSLYKFFSLGAHPNRILVAKRHLGDGNQFVLGPGQPSLTLTIEHFEQLMRSWFWFGAVVNYTWKELLLTRTSSYGPEYFELARRVDPVVKWLHGNLVRVAEEERRMMSPDDGRAP